MDLLDAILQSQPSEAEPGLRALGCRRPEAAYENLRRILASLTPPEFGRMFEALAPALADTPDADRSLNNLERFHQVTTGPLRPATMAYERPYLFAVLVYLFGFSQFMADILIRYPHYAVWLVDPQNLEEDVSAEGLAANLRESMASAETAALRHRAAVRWLRRALLRAGAREFMEMLRDPPESEEARTSAGYAHEQSFFRELSAIAIAVIQVALEEAERQLQARFGKPMEETPEGRISNREAEFIIVGMGKLGGLELNFSSDVDLIFLYSAEGATTGRRREPGGPAEGSIGNHDYFCRLAEAVLLFLSSLTDEGYLYRVDTRLRPDGSEGPLARSLTSFEIYHESQARSWERMALIKARAIAGGEKLSRDFTELSQALVYDRAIGPDIIDQVRELKRKIDWEVETGKDKGREIKRGYGGIREIEFLVQTRQLLHGGDEPALRARSTLDALEQLAARGRIPIDAARRLREDYLVLRRIEHRLQMMDLRQTHTLPAEPAELDTLARRCGIDTAGGKSPGERLMAMWEAISARVHRQFVEFFGELEGESPGTEPAGTPAEQAAQLVLARAPERELIPLLAHYGLESAGAIGSLRRLGGMGGSHYLDRRGQELYQAVMPRLIESASACARPVTSLLHLESFLLSYSSISGVLELFAANPGLGHLLLRAFGAADSWAKTLIAHPEYIDYLLDPEFIASGSSREQMMKRIEQWADHRAEDNGAGVPGALARLRRFEALLTGLADIGGMIPFRSATERLSTVAEVSIEAALRRAAFQSGLIRSIEDSVEGLSVLAMGKLGARELNYFSDLDMIFSWADAHRGDDFSSLATPAAESVMQLLTEVTPEGPPFHIDTRLRPEGQSAPLAPPVSRYLDYYSSRAELWEMQSFMKIRHVAGDRSVSGELIRGVTDLISKRVNEFGAAEIARSMRQMRMRIEQSAKIPKWVLCDFKKGPGGVIDLEFAAQYFQLCHIAENPRLLGMPADEVFASMAELGVTDPATAERLKCDYRFLRQFESRSRLLFETDRSQAPAGGEKWENLQRLCADLAPEGADLREHLLMTLRRNRQYFDNLLP